uniref:Uncharacterized protein n=1 Tax=Globisporangium ultimum (strain ATCC 200006 / CBS 805.95 / DAOM BR144) TaxID=431595 RepID=K3WA55_GLOUD
MVRPKGKATGKPASGGNGKKAAGAAKSKGNGKQKRNAAAAAGKTSVAKDVYSDDEDDAKEARMNAKMDIDGVYEYEQPETFEHDSEISEDEAFNSEDEESYGAFFQSKKKQTLGKKAAADMSEDGDEDSNEEEDEEEDAAGGDLLSDLLGTAPAKRLSTKNDDDDEDSALENSDDEDDEPKNLLSLANGLVPERKTKKKVAEISIDGIGLSSGGAGELTLSSLLGGAEDGAADDSEGLNLSKVKKQVRDLETDGSGALQAAVEAVHEERAARKIAYTEKKKDVDLFQTVVRRNRQKETMDFREQRT